MTYTISFADLQAQDVATVRAEVPADGLADFLGGAFEEVARAAAEQGRHLTGPPFGRYVPHDDGSWTVSAGFPVSAPVRAAGRVVPDRLPVGRAARTLHVGSYEGLGDAYAATEEFIADNGYEPSEQPWELYLDGPEVAEPRTEVFMPCREVLPRPT